MLIENDYRGSPVLLAYKNGNDDGIFTIPENLYTIGTMNTADRSLALVDYALRRRFSFIKMSPKLGEIQGRFKPSGLVKDLLDLVAKLNEAIEKDADLGDGFCIGHSYFLDGGDVIGDDKISTIITHELIPMVEEYWFDNETKRKEWVGKLDAKAPQVAI